MNKRAPYKEKLQHPQWQLTKSRILQRDNATCQLCGDKETTIHVHHKSYTGDFPWDSPDDQLICYCENCHWAVEYLKKKDAGGVAYTAKKRVSSTDCTILMVGYLEEDTRLIGLFHCSSSGTEYLLSFREQAIAWMNEMIEKIPEPEKNLSHAEQNIEGLD